MKLRIQRNSIRVRLNQREVTALAAGEPVMQTTPFSQSTAFISAVATSGTILAPCATLEGARMTLVLPCDRVRQWATSAEVSIETRQAIDGHQFLLLLVEKDFECLHGKEENPDAFPNLNKQGAA